MATQMGRVMFWLGSLTCESQYSLQCMFNNKCPHVFQQRSTNKQKRFPQVGDGFPRGGGGKGSLQKAWPNVPLLEPVCAGSRSGCKCDPGQGGQAPAGSSFRRADHGQDLAVASAANVQIDAKCFTVAASVQSATGCLEEIVGDLKPRVVGLKYWQRAGRGHPRRFLACAGAAPWLPLLKCPQANARWCAWQQQTGCIPTPTGPRCCCSSQAWWPRADRLSLVLQVAVTSTSLQQVPALETPFPTPCHWPRHWL